MTSTDQPAVSHPMVAAVDAIGVAIDEAFETREWTQDPTRAAETTQLLTGLQDRLASLTLRNLAHADQIEVAAETGAPTTMAWLAPATRTTRPDAHRLTLLAKALVVYKHRQVREALAAGSIRVAQDRVIVNAVDALPEDLGEELLWRAEEWLLEQAATFDAAKLKVLGDHLLEVVAPAIAEPGSTDARRAERHQPGASGTSRARRHPGRLLSARDAAGAPGCGGQPS